VHAVRSYGVTPSYQSETSFLFSNHIRLKADTAVNNPADTPGGC